MKYKKGEYCAEIGRALVGRIWELYSGECPPERPCPPEEVRLATLAQWRFHTAQQRRWRLRPRLVWLRARSFACAMTRHLSTGLQQAPAAVQSARAAACNACPRKTDWGTCSLCGCRVEGRILTKISLPLETCPATPPRWGPVEIPPSRLRTVLRWSLGWPLRFCR